MAPRHLWVIQSYALLLVLTACSRNGSSTVGSAGVARTIFVAAASSGAGNGQSWEDALGSLTTALDSAQPGQEIWVASGTYRPAAHGGSREATFHLMEGVALRGGFDGTELSVDDRDPSNPPSILDGDLNGDDTPSFQQRSDNCYHVITAHEVTDVILENFTVRGGYADGPALGPHVESGDQGSGMTVFHAHPHVVRCRFEDNWALNHGTVNDHGGGTYEDCIFTGNYAETLGAGLYFHGDVLAHAHRCRFNRNVTAGEGGGAYSRSSNGATFEDCTFFDNRASQGAGMYMAIDSSTTLSNSYFDGNVAQLGGGGLFVDHGFGRVVDCIFVENEAGNDIFSGAGGAGGSGGGGIWIGGGAPTVEDCAFDGNVASLGAGVYHNDESHAVVRRCEFMRGRAYEAGGLYALQSSVTVEDCSFVGNTAAGGTFSVGGGLSLYFADAQVRRCEFVRNTAQLGGGGAYAEGAAPTIDACRFEGNVAETSPQGWGGGFLAGYFTHVRLANSSFEGNRARRGGAVFAIAFAEPTLVNVTIAGNRALQDGGGILAFASSNVRCANSILWRNYPSGLAGSAVVLEHVCIEGGAAGVGNHGLDPVFTAPPLPGRDGLWATSDDVRGNLRLGPGSPCRDAGNNAQLLGVESLDLDGRARFVDDPFAPDTGVGTLPIVDLGAFEAGVGP